MKNIINAISKVAKTKQAYKPKDDLEKIIGELSTQQGGTDLSADDFKEIKKRFKEKGVTLQKLQEDDSDVYDEATQEISKYLDETDGKD